MLQPSHRATYSLVCSNRNFPAVAWNFVAMVWLFIYQFLRSMFVPLTLQERREANNEERDRDV
jgi:hypothetical protein